MGAHLGAYCARWDFLFCWRKFQFIALARAKLNRRARDCVRKLSFRKVWVTLLRGTIDWNYHLHLIYWPPFSRVLYHADDRVPKRTKQLSPLYRFRSCVNSQYYRWRSFADSSLFVFLKIPSYFVWKLTVIWKSFFVWHNLLTKYLYIIAWQKHSRCRKPFFRKSCVTALRDNIAWRKHSRPSSSIVHRPSSIVHRPSTSVQVLVHASGNHFSIVT